MLWRFKILVKLLLSPLPLGYRFWRKIGLFRLGSMDQAEYALRIFRLHTGRAYLNGIPDGMTCLEIGPGDSVASALIAKAYGVDRIYLVDTGNYARVDMHIYKAMSKWLQKQNIDTPDIADINTFDELLEVCNARYLTNGYESLQNIQEDSIDFIWSHSVLEHIRKKEFFEILCELRRILKFDGCMSHNVDFMDHLGGSLNNLRFSEKFWENDFIANSGFYTNRIRYSEMAQIMGKAGFRIDASNFSSWQSLPTNRSDMAMPFNELSEEELNIRCCDYLLSPVQ